jgi:hypothetical protein
MNARPRAWAAAAALCTAAAVMPQRVAHAQIAATDSTVSSVSAVPTPAAEPQAPTVAGPTLASASVAVRAASVEPQRLAATATPSNALPAARGGQGQPKTLMIVGGAAFLAGALIGDTAGTAIMIGGAGVGLYGLYLYLQ